MRRKLAQTAFTIPAALVAFAITAQTALADTVDVSPSKDNTMFAESGETSNGAGPHVFAGRTGLLAGPFNRRALIAFDVAGSIPAGATINSAVLRLHLSRGRGGNQSMALHRVLDDWGEAGSDSGPRGDGDAAEPGDATWTQRFYPSTPWSTDGGDFAAAPSATATAGDLPGAVTWSTAQMAADVQAWLDDPGSAFGWILIGNEGANQTAKRFESRENLTAANRPLLTVDFTAPAGGSGRVPDGDEVPGVPLVAAKVGAQLRLSWSASCTAADDDYEVYEGILGIPGSHVDLFCSTGGATSWTFPPSGGDRYYLVVPTNGTLEGSYGTDGDGLERGPGTSACRAQQVNACP